MATCVISANCQGMPLARQLAGFMPFTNHYVMKIYTNFQKQIVPDEVLASCNLLIYQKLGAEWDKLSEEYLLSHVNPKAKVICMPNIFNFALYPTARSSGNILQPYTDCFIDELIARKLSLKEIVYVTMKADYGKLYNPEEILKNNIAVERSKGYVQCDKICDFIEENFRKKWLFTTPNHPYDELLNFIAKVVLEEIGYRGVPDCLEANVNCDNDFFMPVHPSVIDFWGLEFIDKDTKYPVFGNNLTYKEYVIGYVKAQELNVPYSYYFLSHAEKQKKAALKGVVDRKNG